MFIPPLMMRFFMLTKPSNPRFVLAAAAVDAPVPPSAIARSVIPDTEPPVIVAPELENVLAVRLPETTVAPLKVVAPVADNVEKAPVDAVVAPIAELLIVEPVIVPPVILGAVMVYVPSRIPSPASRICAIISRMVSFTAEGSIPSGAPSGGAAVLLAGVREYFVYAMIFLTVVLQIADLQEMPISLLNL
jgi:hypothetical protein